MSKLLVNEAGSLSLNRFQIVIAEMLSPCLSNTRKPDFLIVPRVCRLCFQAVRICTGISVLAVPYAAKQHRYH